ncbi:MAG: C4-dicarboxylate TRAP transporter substrate-binding protein [Agathobaculum sp.]|uniref:C4-dicarboxylate TRAP transporter substrate-binding protein n=1 Tax=Agathobaculum sp. TaxID=2048138 RepID=UPI003D8C56DD
MKATTKRLLAALLCGAMALGMTACGGSGDKDAAADTGAGDTAADAGDDAAAADAVTINVGYENAVTEPAAKACEKWKELVEEKSGGSIKLELFPNSTLGKKNDLIDQMLMGENVITVADGAFLADYGVKDFGFFYAPYAFESWDELWKVLDSDWYADLCDQLASTGGLRVLSSNWIYGARDILSIKPVHTPADLAGLKMRVSSNDLSTTSFEDLGATAVGMDMGDVYQAMSGGTIDAVENPITSLYNRSFQEVAKYLCKNEHILATSMWICGETFFSTLTEEQQQILMECADEAGLMNNDLYDEATAEAEQGMIDAGVTVYELTEEDKAAWVEAAQKFFEGATEAMGWTEGLYDTVKAIAAA